MPSPAGFQYSKGTSQSQGSALKCFTRDSGYLVEHQLCCMGLLLHFSQYAVAQCRKMGADCTLVVLQAKKGGGSPKVKLPLIVPKSFRSQHQRAQAAIR